MNSKLLKEGMETMNVNLKCYLISKKWCKHVDLKAAINVFTSLIDHIFLSF